MPDISVQADTMHFTQWYNMLVYSGVQKQTVRDFVVEHRMALRKKYKTFETFQRDFQGDDLLQELCRMAGEANITFSEEEYEKSKSFLTVQLKALLARDLFNENRYYYQVLNSMNPCVRKAYEILSTPSDYQMILREND